LSREPGTGEVLYPGYRLSAQHERRIRILIECVPLSPAFLHVQIHPAPQ
jgi:hypothetical protein